MIGETAPLPVIQLELTPATSYPVTVLPSVSVGGANDTTAVCGQGVAATPTGVTLLPLDELLDPELLELLELEPPPLELELLEFELPPLELLELLELEPPLNVGPETANPLVLKFCIADGAPTPVNHWYVNNVKFVTE